MIPREFTDGLNRDTDLVALIGEYVPLKASGDAAKGCCPFHNEKTPSFSVSRSRNTYHCFGCGESGRAIDFVMKMLGKSFPDAVRMLAANLGRVVPEDRGAARGNQAAKQTIGEVLARVLATYQEHLQAAPDTHPAWTELRRRGFARDTAKDVGFGFAPNEWNALRAGAIAPPAQLVEAGVAVVNRDKTGHYDLLRNRIVIPIRDERGTLVSLAGRALPGASTDVPKYINGPETELYRKSNILFNLDRAADAIRATRVAIIAEGYFDVLVPQLAGVSNMVAPCGTALTGSQLKLIARYADRVAFCFDPDAAGNKAAIAACQLALEHLPDGKTASVVQLSGGDPDELVRARGAQALLSAVEGATPAAEFLLRALTQRHDMATIDGRTAFVREVASLRILSPALRAVILETASTRANLPLAQLDRLVQPASGNPDRVASPKATPLPPEHGNGRPAASPATASRLSPPAVPATPNAERAPRAGSHHAYEPVAGAGTTWPFRIGDQTYRTPTEAQDILARAHAGGARPLCLCTSPPPGLVVAQTRQFILRRLPGDGPSHHPTCVHFSPSDEQSGRALVAGAFQGDAGDLLAVRLAFAFTRRPGTAIPRGPGTPAETVKSSDRGLTCGGVLHMLWDDAEFNRWYPAMEGKRGWGVVRKYLLAAASGVTAKGAPLSEHLLLPLPYRPGDEEQTEVAHQAMIAPLFTTDQRGVKPIRLFIGELKSIDTPPTGPQLACANFFQHPIKIAESMVRRLRKLYATALAMLDAEMEIRIVLCGTVLGDAGHLIADQVFLMPTTRNWIPFSNRYEYDLVQRMTNERRWFIRPLGYDARSDLPIHSFLLTDTGDQVTALNVIPPALPGDVVARREALIQQAPGSWVWKVEQQEIAPPLPAPQRRTQAPKPDVPSISASSTQA